MVCYSCKLTVSLQEHYLPRVADPGFPKSGGQPQRGANLLFIIIFAEYCMKMKEIEVRVGRESLTPLLDLPLQKRFFYLIVVYYFEELLLLLFSELLTIL